MSNKNRKKRNYFYLSIATLFLLLGLFLAVSLGAKTISFQTVYNAFFHYEDTLDMQLVRHIRLPRALTSLMVGGLLAMSGAMMQGVTRNPLTEPSLMGITQGATLAVALLYAITGSATAKDSMISAFIGAFVSGILVLLFTIRNTRSMNISRLLLAGTALSMFFLSLSSLVGILSNNSQNLAFWISGGLRSVTYSTLLLVFILGIIGILLALLLSSKINIVNLGEDVSIGLGVNPIKIRTLTLLLIIPISAVCVAAAGNIAFLGLIVPQIVIKLIGQDFRKIIPVSFLGGALLLVWADLAARMIQQPYETPVGVFTALIGVPFFLWLVRKEHTI